MVLSGGDCGLSRVGVVVVGFHMLSCGLLYLKEVMDGAGAFIVEYLELGFVADRFQVCVDAVEGLNMLVYSLDFIVWRRTALNLKPEAKRNYTMTLYHLPGNCPVRSL